MAKQQLLSIQIELSATLSLSSTETLSAIEDNDDLTSRDSKDAELAMTNSSQSSFEETSGEFDFGSAVALIRELLIRDEVFLQKHTPTGNVGSEMDLPCSVSDSQSMLEDEESEVDEEFTPPVLAKTRRNPVTKSLFKNGNDVIYFPYIGEEGILLY